MVRVLIVDDQRIVREGIKILLHESKEIEIIGDASNGKEGLKKIEFLKPDVVLLDIEMPEVSGLTVAENICRHFPNVKTIMLSSHQDEKYVKKATESGAKGYLLKNASSEELEWSIKLVNQGYSAIKSDLLEQQFSHQTISEPDLKLDKDLKTARKYPNGSTTVLSKRDQENLNKLEFLLADKKDAAKQTHFSQKSNNFKRNKQRKSFFHRLFHTVKVSQAKRTILSFEFRLLVFIILFCLGLLVFIALS